MTMIIFKAKVALKNTTVNIHCDSLDVFDIHLAVYLQSSRKILENIFHKSKTCASLFLCSLLAWRFGIEWI